jgi:alginate O-acetyltransferase complex protein AlgI
MSAMTFDALRTWPALFATLAGCFWFLYSKGWSAGLFTIALSAGACSLFYLTRHSSLLKRVLSYLVFFTTPLLTLTGQISVLTGFAGTGSALPWLGVSFVTASLAHAIYQNTLNPKLLFLSLLQPARWNSGPCAVHATSQPHFRAPWTNSAKLLINFRWIVLGSFFYSVVSTTLGRLLLLKHSSQPIDVLLFAVVFEFYVYFNFAGISFIVFGLMRLVGVPCGCNFNTPFAARNVVGYWQRWHMSLSAILKAIFFVPLKSKIGLPFTVLAVFLGSAVWHGVSINFIIWGCFHSACWFLAYKMGGATVLQRWVQFALLFFAVVIGRLIFSEADTALLWGKLSAFMNSESWGESPLWSNIHLDWANYVAVLFALAWFVTEASGCKLARRYRVLRTPVASALLFLGVIVLGSFDMGGVYGTR